jgi:hypothetical protein
VKTFRSRLLLLIAFLLVFPFFLRRRPRVERRITILAPPASIFPFLDDLRNWPLWTEWSRRDPIAYEFGEKTAGEGGEQRWSSRNLKGILRIVKSDRDERIDYELSVNEGTYEIVGRIELHPDGACTRVIWKCAWDLAKNPYRRYFDLVVRWMIRQDFAAGLENLKAVVESRATESEAAA